MSAAETVATIVRLTLRETWMAVIMRNTDMEISMPAATLHHLTLPETVPTGQSTIRWAATDTPLGRLVLGATDAGLCWVSLAGAEHTLLTELRDAFPRAVIEADDVGAMAAMLTAVTARLAGDRDAPVVPIDLQVTAFQQRVLDALMDIPYGETRSYSQIAAMIGRPGAARAVANVCATNRVAVLIPCHRVIHADGSMSGYRWGNSIKKALLQMEGATLPRGDGAAPAAVQRRRAA